MSKKILFYEPYLQLHSKVISLFMEYGFELTIIQHLADAEKLLETKEYCIIICDASDENVIIFANNLKTNPELNFIHVILCMEAMYDSALGTIFETGISGIITKPFTQNSLLSDFLRIVKKLNLDMLEQRRHIRVEPLPSDKTILDFREPKTYRLIEGKLINISMGGVLCLIENPPPLIEERTVIKNIHIMLNEYLFTVSARLVAQNKTYYAFQFDSPPPAAKLALGLYIYSILKKS